MILFEHTPAYLEFNKFISDVATRKETVNTEYRNLSAKLTTAEESLSTAQLVSAPAEPIIQTIKELTAAIKEKQREMLSLDSSPSKLVAWIKGNPDKTKQAEKIKQDNQNAIEEMQQVYDLKTDKVEKLKSELLQAIGELGQAEYIANNYANEINQVKPYLKGFENTYFSGIQHKNNFVHKTGSIFLDPREVESAYNQGIN